MRTASLDPRHRGSGFTLIEAAIYLTIVAVVGGPLVAFVLTMMRTMAEQEAFARAEDGNRLLVAKLESEFRMAVGSTIVVGNAGRSVTFQPPMGFTDEGIVPGPEIVYELQPAGGEAENGSDDDGDGLVDEGALVRRDVATGGTAIVGENVALDTSRFDVVDGLAVQVRIDSVGVMRRGHPETGFRISREFTVNPRN